MSRRPYMREVEPTRWYLRHARYRAYMLRELTCVLVAIYCVLMLLGLAALASNQPERWQGFLESQQNIAWLIFHTFALVFFVVYQTMAWFRLAPKAMPLQLSGHVVPGVAIVAAHYAGWVVATAAVFWITGLI